MDKLASIVVDDKNFISFYDPASQPARRSCKQVSESRHPQVHPVSCQQEIEIQVCLCCMLSYRWIIFDPAPARRRHMHLLASH